MEPGPLNSYTVCTYVCTMILLLRPEPVSHISMPLNQHCNILAREELRNNILCTNWLGLARPRQVLVAGERERERETACLADNGTLWRRVHTRIASTLSHNYAPLMSQACIHVQLATADLTYIETKALHPNYRMLK